MMLNESAWCRWKENKCANFERPASKTIEARINNKREEKRHQKLSGLAGPTIVKCRQGLVNDPKNGREMFKYFKMPKETLDEKGQSVNLEPCELPDLSTYLYPFLCDQDPDQDVEEPYKNKHHSVFVWRFIREISFIDLVNFLGRPEAHVEKSR